MSDNNDRFARIRRLIGDSGLARLAGSHVAVAGLGAVGGYVVEALARAGVGRMRLIDFDTVKPSNINRQLLALESTIGHKKAHLAHKRVGDINPACCVEMLEVFIHADTMGQILSGPPDLVIDAIDALAPKVELLAELVKRNIPVVSSMGAALRTDATAVRVGPLGKAHHCPLASRVRKMLRRRGLPTNLTCVFSTEPADALPDEAFGMPAESDNEENWRGRKRNVLGSLPTLTGIFGLTAANEAMRILLGGRFFPEAPQM